ncbi:MAG TPA: DUF4405 domain-containing protein [Candidatus Limivivens merdigallinarum]|uniref:DUF4405 domain-containing protein n=1 Tax=Candidatus Limivivens merdigallinarum TaxID=2840859 RepID=A0A9D1D2T1_9FIRM|nr:DUF4405 domain-containing protein [Candidatus Limivivens merdigallinarum]
MNSKQKMKIGVDILMTAGLLFLMPYEMIGEAAHEWIGAGMFVLLILHHILNRKWTKQIGKGSYTPLRVVQTILVALILVCILGSMVSGIILSRHIFSFLGIRGLTSPARVVHMTCAYWGFVLMSLHLGIHWSMMMGMAKKHMGKPSAVRTWIARISGLAVAAYGLYAFLKRDLLSYMLMQVHFVFFDYEEPVAFFILDYMAAMGFFVFLGHYASRALVKSTHRKKH